MCCDSHEHIQEDTVFFEFSPKQQSEAMSLPGPSFPLVIDNFLPKPQGPNAAPSPLKPKAIEIFFFPKKKDSNVFEFPKLSKKKDIVKKTDIQVVGDKELKNEFKSMRYRPTFRVNPKKDEVTDKERDLIEKEREIKEIFEKERQEKKLGEKKLAEKRFEEKRFEEKKLAEKKFEEKKLAEKKFEEKKLAEKKSEERADDKGEQMQQEEATTKHSLGLSTVSPSNSL